MRSGTPASPGTGPTELVERLLPRCSFPPAGHPLVCAVSGGADSSALVLLAVAAACRVEAVHVDHGLRSGSAAEAERVAALADRLGAGFRSVAVSVAPGPNLEARARRARYAALPTGAATGHTADDQAETILINLLRGAGAEGLAGMRPGPERPLLAVRRAETRALCVAAGVDVVEDPTNSDRRFLRNRVRHELLPTLASLSGRDPVPILCRQAGHLRELADLVSDLALSVDEDDAAQLAAVRRPLAAAAVRRRLRALDPEGHPPDSASVERVLAVARGERRATQTAGGTRVRRSAGRLSWSPHPSGPSTRAAAGPVSAAARAPEGRSPASAPTGRPVASKADGAEGQVGGRHHAAELLLGDQGPAGDLRAPGRLQHQPPEGAAPGRDHLDP